MIPEPTESGAAEIIARRDRGLGRITLNRPHAINALTHAMVLAIRDLLDDWAGDDSVHTVVLDGAGDRGFCAGADIRAIYVDAGAGGSATLQFWLDEYRLNALIADYPKPVVAVMDGLVMGGGLGLTAHASHRIVTERSMLAMPEVKIGFIPDVGISHLLARAPGRTGLHVGLTGESVPGDDAIAMGLADRKARHESVPAVIDAIATNGASAAFDTATQPGDSGHLDGQRSWIDTCYAASTVPEIRHRLAEHADPDAQAAARAIDAAAPLAVSVTLAEIRAAAELDTVQDALNLEYRVSSVLFRTPDVAEGIRARIIDKDRRPRWSPARLRDVTPELLAACFVDPPRLPFADRPEWHRPPGDGASLLE